MPPKSSATAATVSVMSAGIGEIAAGGEGVDVMAGEVADGLLGLGLRAEVGDGDVGAVLGESERDGAADALGAAGDERGSCPGAVLSIGLATAGLPVDGAVVFEGGFGVGLGGVAGCFWVSGLIRLLHAGVAAGGLAGVVLVGGDLLLRAEHGDGDLAAGFADEILLSKGGEAVGDDLDADVAAGGDDVDGGLAFGVGLDLQIALVLAVLIDGVEDDGGVDDGLAVGLLDHDDLDVRGVGGSLVLAAAADVAGRPGRRAGRGERGRAGASRERRRAGRRTMERYFTAARCRCVLECGARGSA